MRDPMQSINWRSANIIDLATERAKRQPDGFEEARRALVAAYEYGADEATLAALANKCSQLWPRFAQPLPSEIRNWL